MIENIDMKKGIKKIAIREVNIKKKEIIIKINLLVIGCLTSA